MKQTVRTFWPLALVIALGISLFGFAHVRAAAPLTQIINTSDFTDEGGGDFNAAVNNLYQNGCRYYFQVDAPLGAITGQWVEFTCNNSGPSQTLVLSTHDYYQLGPGAWNAAVAQLTNAGFQQAFWVPSAPGVFSSDWVEFYYVGAPK
jgi:hypothetical protein